MRHFQPARLGGLGAPESEDMVPTASATFSLGAPLQRNSSNKDTIEEAAGGATVTGIIGIAGQPCASGVPNFGAKVQVFRVTDQISVLGQVYDSGGAAVATVAGDGTYLGNTYGIVKVAGDWFVDEDDTTNVVLTVVKELPELNAVLFTFIGSAIAD